MKHPKVLLSVILTLWAMVTTAQNNYQPGYYINNYYDTIYGQIDNRGDQLNGSVCSFRVDSKSEIIRFAPSDIVSYRFIEGKYYVSRSIEFKGEIKLVFLEYLVDGISSLYYHRSNNTDHYYIEDADGNFTELTNEEISVEKDGKTYVGKSTKYIGQLRSSFSDAPELSKEIDHVQFNHESLINVTSDYHNYVCQDGQECIVYEKKLPAVRIGVGPVIGFSSSGLDFPIYPSYDEYTYNRSWDFILGLSFYITLPRINEKLSFVFHVEYNDSYFYGYKENITSPSSIIYQDLHIHLTTVKGLFGIQYMYPKGKIRPTITAGPLLSYNLESDFKHVDENMSGDFVFTREYHEDPLLDESYGAFISLGANWNVTGRQHLGLNLRYHFAAERIGTIVHRDGLTMLVAYYF